jgi:CRP/FNR family cyclic AMP-dependent transcriptional regulator
MDTNKRDFIAAALWLEGVNPDCIDFLAKNCQIRHFPEGRNIVSRGTVSKNLYGVVAGSVRISTHSARGQHLIIDDGEAGKWLGELSLFDTQPSMVDLRTREESTIMFIANDIIHKAGERWPEIYRGIAKWTAKVGLPLLSLVELVAAHPLSVRLAFRILGLVNEFGVRQDDGSYIISKRVTQTELADMAYGTRQHVNRIMKQWNSNDLLMMKGNNLVILDRAGLFAEANETGFSS